MCGAAVVAAGPAAPHQQQQPQRPVPILKQVNRQNEDGSYSYGYENADGTYKIETKYPTGEVYGKYGYVDETGQMRTVEYGASARGFEPAGTGITVPPPVPAGGDSNDLRDRPAAAAAAAAGREDDYDDGQYREDPSVYYKEFAPPAARMQQQQQQQRWSSSGTLPRQKARQEIGHAQPAHPAVRDFDPASGSFSISYTTRR